MNHLFQHVSWLHYGELLAFALLIYYLYVGLGWYRPEIVKLFRAGRAPSAAPEPVSSLLQQSDAQDFDGTAAGVQVGIAQRADLPESEMLTTGVLAAIAESSGQPYEPASVVMKLKAVIR